MGDFAKGIKAFKAGMKDEEEEAEATAPPAQVPPPAAAKAAAAPAASVTDHTREPAKTV
jgi:sec-independent protein translocase protein TatA